MLALVYGVTAARDVTFWDAGEFLTAFATFGAPHPPGTPLFVAFGRAWTLAAGAFGVDPALAGNLLAAACAAAAGACTAWLVARWTRSAACGVAGALCAGAMSTAWANATEAEVYAASLLLACAALVAGEAAGKKLTRGGGPPRPESPALRPTAATAYALALAVPLHLSALVAAPAALWLTSVRGRPRTWRAVVREIAWPRLRAQASAVVLVAGAGTARAPLVVLGAAGLLACAAASRFAGCRRGVRETFAIAGAVVLALSATLVLLLRARHDPWLNQGDPSTWARFVDVVARRQYAVADLWPRQAPWWLQLANLGEWADWQVALGVSPGAPPTAWRTPVTAAYAALGIVGAWWHRRRDLRSWGAVLLLLLAGSVGVAAWLNLKAGPSFGVGVLPDSAPHEARERDYFFALAWWAWGIWAGVGAVVVSRVVAHRAGQGIRRMAPLAGMAVAALPIALNWEAASRTQPPTARAAGDFARALLTNAPPRAVLIVNADNDTYPLWQAQAARGIRRDVTIVTVSLLPAAWYRAELARRAGLLAADSTARWLGFSATLATIRDHAHGAGRPLAASLATDDATRRALDSGRGLWVLRGLTVEWRANETEWPASLPLVTLPTPVVQATATALGDSAAIATAAARAATVPTAWLRDSTGDGVVAWAYRQLACPAAALAPPTAPTPGAPADSLEGPCRAR